MVDFQTKKRIRKIMYSRITMVVLIVFIIILSKAVYDILLKEKMSTENLAILEKDYLSLKERQVMLKDGILKLNTNQGIEEEIRQKYSVAKPGETVVVMVDSTSSSSTSQNNTEKSIWRRILDIF